MTSDPVPEHVLITQGFLYNMAGSETVTFEVAEYFASAGCTVTVVTHGHNELWTKEFSRLENTRLMVAGDPDLALLLRSAPPTLAWLQHQLVPEAVLRRPPQRVIFNQMSAAHPLEYAFSTAVVRSIGSLFTFNSKETLDVHLESNILAGIPRNRLAVFGNPAPNRFLAAAPRAPHPLRNILVVSNHIPEEILGAINELKALHGIRFTIVGIEKVKSARPMRVTPRLIQSVDAVLTIGKTVQYSIASGVPVYCYDHFGGPGWLDRNNVARAKEFNFSGRGFGRKSVKEISTELVEFYSAATMETAALRERIAGSLTMGERMPVLVEQAQSAGLPEYSLSEEQIQGHLKMQDAIGAYAVKAASVDEQIVQIQSRARQTQERLRAIEASPSFSLAQKISRFSAAVQAPIRLIRSRVPRR